MSDLTPEKATALRKPFPKESIGKLPKGGAMLDYVGHAAVTDRLLTVDPEWTWEPLALGPDGLPALDRWGKENLVEFAQAAQAGSVPAPRDEPAPEPAPTRRMSRKTPSTEAEKPGEVDGGDPMSAKTRGHLFALFTELGVTDRDEQIKGIVGVIGRPIASRSELTEDEGRSVVLSLEAWKAQNARGAEVPA